MQKLRIGSKLLKHKRHSFLTPVRLAYFLAVGTLVDDESGNPFWWLIDNVNGFFLRQSQVLHRKL